MDHLSAHYLAALDQVTRADAAMAASPRIYGSWGYGDMGYSRRERTSNLAEWHGLLLERLSSRFWVPYRRTHDDPADGHVGVVVDGLAAATGFFVRLGLELPGEGPAERRWRAVEFLPRCSSVTE